MASAFSRTLLSEGFSKWPRSFISRKRPSRCIFYFNALRAWSTLLSRTKTCTPIPFGSRDQDMDMDSSGADGNCGTNTARGDPFQRHNGVRSNHQVNNVKATVRNEKMKLITTWHCTEVLQGEESETTPREWLILVGPGEDLIFEVKTAPRPTSKPNESATRH